MLEFLNGTRAVRTAALLIACAAMASFSLNTEVTGPGALVIAGGDQQSAPANTALPNPLEVIVVDQFGVPLNNITINWTIAAGGGSLSASSSVSDDNGHASVNYTTGPTPGRATVNAQVSGLMPLSFTITIT